MIELDRATLLDACASPAWADLVLAAGPFDDLDALLSVGAHVWEQVGPDDWRAALAAHPRIGERPLPETQEAREQAGVEDADPAVLAALAQGNVAYEERFGMTYVVRARGRSAAEMLELLHARLTAAPADELRTAAGQQWEITALRLTELAHVGGARR